MSRAAAARPRTVVKPPGTPKGKATIGCYPLPAAHAPPPDFGPNCVPAAVARQIDAHFAARRRSRNKKLKKMAPEEVEPTAPAEPTTNEAADVAEKYSLCIPQSPARFSTMSVADHAHPCQSILQNPQRIVADGPFAINEPVKPKVVSLNFDGLRPLRLNARATGPDVRKTLRDLQFLVQASLRNRNVKDEASAYFNIGLLYESEGQLRRANENYMKYLQTLGADADPLVFNRIAVNFQLLHRYEEAIEWNMRHLSFSRSMFETIAANCNIALVYREMGENAKSVEFYKSALETAEEMEETEDSPFYDQIERIRKALKDQIELAGSQAAVQDAGGCDTAGQSFGDRNEETEMTKKQIEAREKYYEAEARISRQQGDLSKAYEALMACGKLNCVYGDFERADRYYQEALEVARKIGSTELVNHAKVAIGIAKGNKQLKDYGLFNDVGIPNPALFKEEI